MAITYGFFNSLNGDRKYNAENIGRYLHGIVSSGVYADSSDSLQVFAGSGMEVIVQPGRAMLDYHYMENDDTMTLTLAAGGTQDRIDAIVARLDMTNRLCEIAVVTGTPAATPVRPTMRRTDVIKEYMLASVYVTKLSSEITQANITDTRPDTTVCGWVTGVIDQVDTSTLWAQWVAAYEQAYSQLLADLAANRATFDAWYAALSEDLNVLTYVEEYTNLVTLTEDTNTIPIGIAEFDPIVDVLFVNYRGLTYATSDYTITGTGADAAIVLRDDTRKAGDPIEFRVLKSKIGVATDAAATSVLLANESGGVLTDDGETLTI